MIAGNTLLYGATGGKLLLLAGLQNDFAFATPVPLRFVEGCGDHSCEYMTKGTAVILGPVGNNFAAGMTGGEAFVFDPESKLEPLCNQQTATIRSKIYDDEFARLRSLINEFANKTESQIAKEILDNWSEKSQLFKRVAPDPLVPENVVPKPKTKQIRKTSSV